MFAGACADSSLEQRRRMLPVSTVDSSEQHRVGGAEVRRRAVAG